MRLLNCTIIPAGGHFQVGTIYVCPFSDFADASPYIPVGYFTFGNRIFLNRSCLAVASSLSPRRSEA